MLSVSQPSPRTGRTSSGQPSPRGPGPRTPSADASALAPRAPDAFDGARATPCKAVDAAALEQVLASPPQRAAIEESAIAIVDARLASSFWVSMALKFVGTSFIHKAVRETVIPGVLPTIVKHAVDFSTQKVRGGPHADLNAHFTANQDALIKDVMADLEVLSQTADPAFLRDLFHKGWVQSAITSGLVESIPELAAMIETHGRAAFPPGSL